MKHLPSDTYNVAWFKLAECVARGEKEKALGVYRLLVHSLEDPAVICQLEGDLLLSFKDAQAIDKYIAAASLYKKNNKIGEAAALYEHIVSLAPDAAEHHIHTLIDLYQDLNIGVAQVHQRVVLVLLGIKEAPAHLVFEHAKKTIDALLQENKGNALQVFLAKLQALDSALHEKTLLYINNK